MIVLHQLPKLKNKSYSISPFCLKLEIYLKYTNLSYENKFSLEFNHSPTNKFPFIERKGYKYSDSSIIVNMLEEELKNNALNNHLTNEQKAISLAFQRLIEEHLYWGIIYSRWIDLSFGSTWKKTLQESLDLPKIMFNILYPSMRRNATKQILGQGLNLISKSEIYNKIDNDLKSIAYFLGDKKYFFNEKLSILDIICYSFLEMINNDSCNKKIKSLLNKYSNLKNFCDRFNY